MVFTLCVWSQNPNLVLRGGCVLLPSSVELRLLLAAAALRRRLLIRPRKSAFNDRCHLSPRLGPPHGVDIHCTRASDTCRSVSLTALMHSLCMPSPSGKSLRRSEPFVASSTARRGCCCAKAFEHRRHARTRAGFASGARRHELHVAWSAKRELSFARHEEPLHELPIPDDEFLPWRLEELRFVWPKTMIFQGLLIRHVFEFGGRGRAPLELAQAGTRADGAELFR